MRANPSVWARSRHQATASGVFCSVGVMIKLAGAKSTSALWVMPLVSRPAMGWLAMNSTPSGSICCTGAATPRLTPDTSVASTPGLSQPPYCLTQSSSTVGYKPKMTRSARLTSARSGAAAPRLM